MAAAAGSSVIEGLRTLEVRWLLPGPLDAAVAGWFGRFPAETESREDTYLVDPDLRGLSVKVRAGRSLEVKMCHGTVGLLDIPGRARGRIQSWQKWSFPVGPLRQDGDAPAGWTVMGKSRRISRFRLAREGIVAEPGRAGEPGCAVELTEVRARDETWWSLGFEAAGPVDLVRAGLEGTAEMIFARPLPGGAELGPGDCRSYANGCPAPPATAESGGAGPLRASALSRALADPLDLRVLVQGLLWDAARARPGTKFSVDTPN